MSNTQIKLKSGKWTPIEDTLLTQLIEEHGEKQWKLVASFMQTRTPIQCLHRWTKILKPGLVKGLWTSEEDKLLMEYVETFGSNNWSNVGKIIQGRSGKQCRERWLNNLSPNIIKGHWKKDEDEKIFIYFLQYGTQWCKIAKFLPGRTENSIKNRIYSTIRKIKNDHIKKFMKSQSNTTICYSQPNDLDFDHKNEKEFINSLIIQKLQKLQQMRDNQTITPNQLENCGELEEEKREENMEQEQIEENQQFNNHAIEITENQTYNQNYSGIKSMSNSESQQEKQSDVQQTQQTTVQKGEKKVEQYSDLRSQILFIEQQIFSVKSQIEKIIHLPQQNNQQNIAQQDFLQDLKYLENQQEQCLISGDDLFEKYTAQPNMEPEDMSFNA